MMVILRFVRRIKPPYGTGDNIIFINVLAIPFKDLGTGIRACDYIFLVPVRQKAVGIIDIPYILPRGGNFDFFAQFFKL